MKWTTWALAALLSLSLLQAGKLSGRRAPSFALPDAAARFIDILDYRGKPLLIDIMQTGCPHCQSLSKTLDRVKAKYGTRIGIVAIVNPPDNAQTVAQYVAKNKVQYPVLFDFGTTAANYMQVTPQNPSIDLPHLFLVDANGMIVEDFGWSEANKKYLEGDALFPILDRMLGGAAAPKPAAKK
jgi:peroxiredoxin